MKLRDETFQRWWPCTQSLDLVEGPVERVAAAVQAEVTGFLEGEEITTEWAVFPSLDAAFQAAPDFANVPTFYLVLPTHSRWTVLWNNSFLCNGYDSLCWNLTRKHGLTTVHWAAHDEWTTFQSGTTFVHRRLVGSEMMERTVQAAQEDKRWLFYELGEALPEEDRIPYRARRKRDRFNEAILSKLLARLGASPWAEAFYAVPGGKSFVLLRGSPPPTVIRRQFTDIRKGANNGFHADADKAPRR